MKSTILYEVSQLGLVPIWFKAEFYSLSHTFICLCAILVHMCVGQNKAVPALSRPLPVYHPCYPSCFAKYVMFFKSCLYAEFSWSTSREWNHSAESTQQMSSCGSPKLGGGWSVGALVQGHPLLNWETTDNKGLVQKHNVGRWYDS